MAERKRLSLCIITKNDEEYLYACLKDMEEIADEAIVFDIGSSDRTVEIAKQAGAVVYQMEWHNNYSEVKNICLENANGRWVLFLQADESISKEQMDQMKQLLDNPNAEAYLVYVDYDPEERGVSSPAQSLRLIRNRKKYRFQYKSFEYIPDELLSGIQDSYLKIVHRGRSTVSWELRSRDELLRQDLAENAEDSYVQYMYGIELLNRQEYEESAVHFELSRKKVNWAYLYAPHLYKCLGWVLLYLERYPEALEVLNEGIAEFLFYTDLLVLRAELYQQLEQDEEAVRDLETCLEIKKRSGLMVPGPEIDDSVIQELLGEIKERG